MSTNKENNLIRIIHPSIHPFLKMPFICILSPEAHWTGTKLVFFKQTHYRYDTHIQTHRERENTLYLRVEVLLLWQYSLSGCSQSSPSVWLEGWPTLSSASWVDHSSPLLLLPWKPSEGKQMCSSFFMSVIIQAIVLRKMWSKISLRTTLDF